MKLNRSDKCIIVLMISIVLLLAIFVTCCLPKELDISKAWCSAKGGIAEYRLLDMSRVDCLLEEYAVEVEWAHKWPESIGQSMYYAISTGKKPAVLIIRENNDSRYITRFEKVAKKLKIKYWYFYEKEVSDVNAR